MADGSRIAEHEIAEFWKACILSELYEKRPRKQDFHAEGLSEVTGLSPEVDVDEFFDDVIDWLKEEHLIRVADEIAGQVFSVSLTSRGLGMMARQEAGWSGSVGASLAQAAKNLPSSLVTGTAGMAFAALRKLYGL